MSTRVHFAYPQGAVLRNYEGSYLRLIREELTANGAEAGFALESDPVRADLIVMLQSAQYKTIEYILVLESDPLIRAHAERVFVIDYDDHPEGLLSGLYTSIEQPFFDSERHASWPILFMNNPLVYELTREEISEHEPALLFSFIGAESHQLRTRLFAHFVKPAPEYHVCEINKFYNHDDGDRRRFVRMGLDSAFCLCPRGFASYSNRICEVMAMGRVPVIIADEWIPFSFAEELPYYVRVLERDMERLPEMLSARKEEAKGIGRNARLLWERYCSGKRRTVAAVERIATLAAEGKKWSYSDYRKLWHSRAFLSRAGWTARQRLALKVEQHARRWFPSVRIPGVVAGMRYENPGNLK